MKSVRDGGGSFQRLYLLVGENVAARLSKAHNVEQQQLLERVELTVIGRGLGDKPVEVESELADRLHQGGVLKGSK